MKKHIILTYIVTGLCNIAIAQTTLNTCPPTTKTEAEQNQTCQDGKGITTNPSNPVNTECPILINNFDWKLKQPISNTIIEEVYSVYDADNIYRTIRNPFDDNTNSDYGYLALKQNSNYYPEDGWELLCVNSGRYLGHTLFEHRLNRLMDYTAQNLTHPCNRSHPCKSVIQTKRVIHTK